MNNTKQELQSKDENYQVALSILNKVVDVSTVIAQGKDEMTEVLSNSRAGLKDRVENEFYQ